MGERINLPDGGWVQLRDTPTWGGRLLMQAAYPPIVPMLAKLPKNVAAGTPREQLPGVTFKEMLAFADFQKTLVVAYVDSWSLPIPTPRCVEDCDELNPDVGDAIAVAAAPAGLRDVFGIKVSVDDAKTDGSPTEPSETSNGSSEGMMVQPQAG